MEHRSKVTNMYGDYLIDGMTDAFDDMQSMVGVTLSNYHNDEIRPEYLMTLGIAKRLSGELPLHSIRLEYSARRALFAAGAAWDGASRREVEADLVNQNARDRFSTKSRVDICVLEEDGEYVPAAIVEVKLGVRSLRSLEEDLLRLAMFARIAKRSSGPKLYCASTFGLFEESSNPAKLDKLEKRISDQLVEWNHSHGMKATLSAPANKRATLPLKTELEEYDDGKKEILITKQPLQFQPCLIQITN